MDTMMERSSFIQAFQRQLNSELARGQERTWETGTPTRARAERITLRDGTAVTLRPIQPDDVRLLWEMHQRLSNDTLFFRYLRVYNPTLADLTQICNLNDERGGALVATTGRLFKQIVAVAYYIKAKPASNTAEAAFLVEDHFQGRGLGQLLWQQLVRHGRERGITTFEAYVHPDNAAMLHLIRKSGLPVSEEVAYDLREIQVQLTAAEAGLFAPVNNKSKMAGFAGGGVGQ
jgi:RimJ/RimL family protein N-acetyltransferase